MILKEEWIKIRIVKDSRKILITGGAGFIGFHLSKRLIQEGYEVIGLDSINDYYDVNLKKARLKILSKTSGSYSFIKHDISRKSTIDLLKEINPDFIVNLAANAGVRYSIKNPRIYVKNNIYGFLNILEAAKKPISFVTTGQNVPEDIKNLNQYELAKLVIGEKIIC